MLAHDSVYHRTAKHFLRDAEMACPARRTAYWLHHARVYLFQFNHVALWQPLGAGASHSSDIPFLFHVTAARPGDSSRVQNEQVLHSDEEIALSTEMIRAWHSFASIGAPPTELVNAGWTFPGRSQFG